MSGSNRVDADREAITGRILVVDDEESMRFFLERRLRRLGHFVRTAANAAVALSALASSDWDLVLLDIKMPGRSGLDVLPEILAASPRPRVVIMTGHSTLENAVKAVGLGASEYVEKPFSADEIADVVSRELFAVFEERGKEIGDPLSASSASPLVLGLSAPIVALRNEIDKVARTDLPVLIRGERGTEKERVARAIHERSARREGPFVFEECGTFNQPSSGPKKEPDPGALFDRAKGGTLFLDEIEVLSPAFQVALLRVLEKREIHRKEGEAWGRSDFRVIAAGEDLDVAVGRGGFREDLFFRLAVIPLWIPPLRERPGDPSWLACRFLEENAGPRVSFSREVFPLLESYEWPRNVWELRNVVERAAAGIRGNRIGPDAFPGKMRKKEPRTSPSPPPSGSGRGPFSGGGPRHPHDRTHHPA